MDNFRIRVIPVLGTSPAIFGQSLAAYVLCQLGRTSVNRIGGDTTLTLALP